MKKIKICHVIGDFVNGGVESVIYNYFSHMNLVLFEVHIIAHGIKVPECAEKFEKLGFKIYNITPKRESFIKSIIEMNRIFKIERYDIIHSHLTEWACVPMVIGSLNNIRIRINHSHMVETPIGFINKIYYKIRLEIGKLFATHYFACGDDAGKYLFGKKCFESGRVKIIRNAIDTEKFSFNTTVQKSIRDELCIADETLCIGHVGRFFEQKNHSFLIDIFNELHNICPNSVLLLIGDGEDVEKIKIKVSQMNLSDAVKFLGVKQNVYSYYMGMDAFVLPSLFEGLPVVGIEAQASGLPCIFSECVTHQIAVTNNVGFVSLDRDSKHWAKKILEFISFNIDRTSVNLDRYNIRKYSMELEKFYENVCNKN